MNELKVYKIIKDINDDKPYKDVYDEIYDALKYYITLNKKSLLKNNLTFSEKNYYKKLRLNTKKYEKIKKLFI